MADGRNAIAQPPEVVRIEYCPDCGANDLYRPFTGKRHYAGGERCVRPNVELVTVVYRRESDARC